MFHQAAALLLAAAFPGAATADVSLQEVWTLKEGLDRPESVVFDAGRNVLYVSNIGGKLIAAAADAGAENPGRSRYLREIDLESRQIEPLAGETPIGGVDAVEPDEHDGYFLSDWPAGKVMYFSTDGEVKLLEDLSQGTADLEYVAEQQMVYLPIMMSDQLVGYRVAR